ncbi:MAG: hypothetical protein ACD_19C00429G0012 [uncultured bacterium]|nr:MAG: hypothetical protein ACD_19C00429G0012 [uncultured bacterium]
MIFKFIKIWFKVVRDKISFKYLSQTLIFCFISLILIYFLINRNFSLSIFCLFILIATLLVIRLILFYKELVNLKIYDLILLKPIDPLFSLIVYNRNPADIIILLPILIYLKIKNIKS